MTKLTNNVLFLCCLLTVSLAFGQRKSMSHPRTKAIKLTYIAEKSNLTTAEENTFWNIFDRYEDEVFDICRKPLYRLRKQLRSSKTTLSDLEIKGIINKMDSLEELMLSKKRIRNAQLLKELPAQKVLLIFNAENKFNYHAIDKLRKKSSESASNENNQQ